MEIAKYLCEFFFCDFLHFIELLLIAAAIGGKHIINYNKKRDSHE